MLAPSTPRPMRRPDPSEQGDDAATLSQTFRNLGQLSVFDVRRSRGASAETLAVQRLERSRVASCDSQRTAIHATCRRSNQQRTSARASVCSDALQLSSRCKAGLGRSCSREAHMLSREDAYANGRSKIPFGQSARGLKYLVLQKSERSCMTTHYRARVSDSCAVVRSRLWFAQRSLHARG